MTEFPHVTNPVETETDAPLRSYVRARQIVTRALREAQAALRRHDGSDDEQLHDLLSRLAEDRFHLVVLGQFKRGKSSLINAILGRDLLPTAAVPLTSAVTSLRYGPVERAIIRRHGRAMPDEIPVARLPDYITERGNPRNEKRVLSAEIETPAPFLRRGLRFIDTPGIGSIHAHNTATTYAFLPEADAAIFVTSAESPLTEDEAAFLDAIRQHVRKLFFVLNKIDQVDAAEQSEVASFTARALAARLGEADVRLFPISAREALRARASGDDARLAASGQPALEEALATFLSTERSAVFLTALLDRALRRVDTARFTHSVEQEAQRWSDADRQGRLAQIVRRAEALERDRQAAIDGAHARLDAWREDVLSPALETFASEARHTLETELPDQADQQQSLDAEALTHALAAWGRVSLDEHAEQWQQAYATVIEEAVRALIQETQPRVTAAIREVRRATAAASAVPLSGDGEEEEDLWSWLPPRFNTMKRGAVWTSDGDDSMPFTALLPNPLARRAIWRRNLRALEEQANCVTEALRRHVSTYLDTCLREMDASSAAALSTERQRLEAIFQSGYDGDGEDRRGELDRIAGELTRLRDALLQTGIIPDRSSQTEAVVTSAQEAATAAAASIDLAHRVDNGRAPVDPDGQETPVRETSLNRTTCPLCDAASNAVFTFLRQWQYALATDEAAQSAFRAAGGLCHPHTWQLEYMASPRGLSIAYPSVLEKVAHRVRALTFLAPEAAGRQLGDLIPDATACAACLAQQRGEQEMAARLVADLATSAGHVALEQSHGLCLRHLALLLPNLDAKTADLLLRHQARRLTDVAEAMHNYDLKVDARRRDLLMPQEDNAYRHALILLTGERQVT